MGKGGYSGGSTLLNPGSSWFSKPKSKSKNSKPKRSARKAKAAMTPAEKEAELKFRIKLAAEKLAKTKADFDAGLLRPKVNNGPAKAIRRRNGKKASPK